METKWDCMNKYQFVEWLGATTVAEELPIGCHAFDYSGVRIKVIDYANEFIIGQDARGCRHYYANCARLIKENV